MSPVLSTGSRNPDDLLDLFEQAWRSGKPPVLEDFLRRCSPGGPPANDAAQRKFLEHLVTIDLEYRWRQAGGRERPRMEDYAARLPELGRPEKLSCALIGAEYRVRQRWGDRPNHAEYAARFPQQGPALLQVLSRIDAELALEDQAAASIQKPVQSVGTVAHLLDTLRQCNLLGPAQLEELVRGHFAEPRALASELLRRNWLTPYQVNQLLQGRGRDLVVGPYLLLERLGEGGAGQVFKARHQKMNRIVALKLIRKELLTDAEVVGRFYREIQVLSQLDHPNVVHAYDAGPASSFPSPLAGESGGRGHFLAMEYVEGTDLGKLVKQGGPLPVQQACEYIRQAAAGLQHAHERGLVHRDIKPHNLIMSVRDGLIKVADLGLARLPRGTNTEMTAALSGVKGTGTLTPENAVMMGTADYLAPEQALDFHKADIRSDIYSLGCTFYYLLTGQPPFPGATLAEKLVKHQQAEPPGLEKFRKDLPAGLPLMVRKMLAKRPEERYQTPAELADALAPYCSPGSTVPVLAQASSSGSQQAPRRIRRWPVVRVPGWLPLFRASRRRVVAAGAVLLLAGLLLLWWRPWSEISSPRPWSEISSPLDQLSEGGFPDWPKQVVALLPSAGPRSQARSVAFSPDRKLLAIGGKDGSIRLWDPVTAKETSVEGHQAEVTGLAFSPDSKTLASVSLDKNGKNVKLWEPATGKERATTCAGHKGGVLRVAFSPDGRLLATGSWGDEAVKLWDTAGQVQGTMNPVKGEITALVFAPDGKTLAVASSNNPVRLWEPATGQDRTLNLREGRTLGYAPDGKTLAFGASGGAGGYPLQLWDPAKAELVARKAGPSPIVFTAFSPDGSTLVSVSQGGIVVQLDRTLSQTIREWRFTREVQDAALASDGRHLAVAIGNGAVAILRLAPGPSPAAAK